MEATDARHVERVLATARALLAAGSLIAIYVDPTSPSSYATLVYGLLVVYVVYSAAILAVLRFGREPKRLFRIGLHVVDILWPAVISGFTEGPSSPFYVYYAFVLLAAAYRWGWQETLATTAAGVLLSVAQAGFFVFGHAAPSGLLGREFELNRFIIRSLYLVLMGFLLGYLAEEEKRLRAETWVAAHIMSKAQAEIGLRATIQALLEEILELFGARQALVSIADSTAGRGFLWEVRPPSENRTASIFLTELEPAEGAKYSFDAAGQAWSAARRARPLETQALDVVTLDSKGARLRPESRVPPGDFLAGRSWERLLAVAISIGEDWSGRLYLLDPDPSAVEDAALRLLQNLARQVAPAVYNVYLLRRLRSKAGAVERARVARELHDGVIQPLIAIEMQLDALQSQAANHQERLAEGLARIQQLLRQEVVNVREMMEHLKPLDVRPQQLLEILADVVEKFHRETGIAASFASDLEEVDLTPRVCRELARIVQEALVNVRKHSGARNVLVRLSSQDARWVLVVDDDGRGFGFSGHLNQNELDAARRGPLVIKERVRSIGAELVVESGPGQGARLEISIPHRGVRPADHA